ncbi:Mitoguardin 2 [Bienertia sinuspersici]
MDGDHFKSTKEALEAFSCDELSFAPPPTSLAFMESLTMPHYQEVVISADLKCTECQKRMVDMISCFNNETESLVVNLSEKKVVITCEFIRDPKKQIIHREKSPFNKVSLIKRIFGSLKS